jgi:hypothetical protein
VNRYAGAETQQPSAANASRFGRRDHRHIAATMVARSEAGRAHRSKSLQERDQVALLSGGQGLGRAGVTVSVALFFSGLNELWKTG